jgi:hypothetical protein
LPIIFEYDSFALKGGTALNFFIRNMPRISVDIDLTYLPICPRKEALENITNSLIGIATKARKIIPEVRIQERRISGTNALTKMFISLDDATIKIEPNLTLRGSVHKSEIREIVQSAQQYFELTLNARVLSFEDLYGGKICAALDRQHPRDLFDVDLLLRNEGLSRKTLQTFLVYLISHPRPIIELLNPNLLDIKALYDNEFAGMPILTVEYEQLLETRRILIASINEGLTIDDRKFLLSIKEGNPTWDLLRLPDIEILPAVRWKLENIKKIEKNKHKKLVDSLKRYLGI